MRDSVFSVKIYILYSCKKIHIERNHHNFKSSVNYILSYCSSINKAWTCKKNLKNNINKNIYRWASKRVIKTLIYKKVNLPLSNNECRSGKTKKKKPALYENIPQHYIHTHLLRLLSHCIDNLQYCRQVRLEKHKYDSNINKAEHGYNIGMHAVNKHPVNNILRLNKVFL